MNCDHFKKNISPYLDGELSDSQAKAFEHHSRTCAECHRELAAYKVLLKTASDFEIIQAPDHLWQKIAGELASPAQQSSPIVGARKWLKDFLAGIEDLHFGPRSILIGGLTLLILGMLIGGNLMKPSMESTIPEVADSEAPEGGPVQVKAERYLEKSKILFLGLINEEEDGYKEMDYQMEQKVARNLLEESAELRNMIPAGENARLSQLIQELETILWEIAALKENEGVDHVELIKSGIERRGIMLKIYLNELKQGAKNQSSSGSL